MSSAYLEQLLELWRDHSGRLSPEWCRWFASQESESAGLSAPAARTARNQVGVLQMINAYRFRGHRAATLDPLRQERRPRVAELDPAYYGLQEADMEVVFETGSLFGVERASLRETLEWVRAAYCGSVGAEYMHITDTAQKRWIQERLESKLPWPRPDPEERLRILERLTAAQSLEQFLSTRYTGQKRFSLEGGESLIPMLDKLVSAAGEAGILELVIAMAHRGRLNVLVNILGKTPSRLCSEFEEGTHSSGSDDVKYHLGYSADLRTASGSMHLTLAFNPSHLEIVGPVVEGSVRARQERVGAEGRKRILPVLIHGDAAFAGQGVVMETFNLSQTRGYSTGGTLHIIINNQIGFTTSDPLDARSTLYCTDVAKMVQAPIFHVNADDPEALLFISKLALDYRMHFHKDVVVDMVCYRRHGHSEVDEPSVTQPRMYRKVRNHPGTPKLYAQALLREGVLEPEQWERMRREYLEALDAGRVVSAPHAPDNHPELRINYSEYRGNPLDTVTDTTLSEAAVRRLGKCLVALPEGFQAHPSVGRILAQRTRMARGDLPGDWGFAESLAYASLVEQGFQVRVSGQDCCRGTFFHRHAVLYDQESGTAHVPVAQLDKGQAKFRIVNSTLSEEAVLAFEYGYSSADPKALVVWEAQFGDFANGAQVVFDQFLSSSERKWGLYCGLVVLLPHGYDGQGPEHSSARLERYLQLCAEENLQVCVPSNAAQMFHLLRRQVLRPCRKPLLVMSPKSLLRHASSASPLAHFARRGFQFVLDDPDEPAPAKVRRLLFCCGKIYYDLLEKRRTEKIESIAILRIEQLYPFPTEEVGGLLARYREAVEVIWVQEEPRNQGAWNYIKSRHNLLGQLVGDQHLDYVGREASASPATGLQGLHRRQQQLIPEQALLLGRHAVLQRRQA